METLNFDYQASQPAPGRAHVGVVGSGDLEVLLEPSPDERAHVTVRTSADGFGEVWEAVLDRFFARNDLAAAVEINDSGATPGTVALRLAQAVEESRPRARPRGQEPGSPSSTLAKGRPRFSTPVPSGS
jgi:malonate decarboxylase delta subunit